MEAVEEQVTDVEEPESADRGFLGNVLNTVTHLAIQEAAEKIHASPELANAVEGIAKVAIDHAVTKIEAHVEQAISNVVKNHKTRELDVLSEE